MANNIDTIKKVLGASIRAKNDFLSDSSSLSMVSAAAELIVNTYRNGGKLIVFGNGGSAADSQHMAAELVVRFEKERKPLPCIALTVNTSNLTAIGNDYNFDKIFSRQVEALAVQGDAALAISTSGMSANIIEGARMAAEKGLKVIALTGAGGGKLAGLADIAIVVASGNTARIQEIHVVVIHALCKIIEDSIL